MTVEFDLALAETQYQDATHSLVAASRQSAVYQHRAEVAEAALARVYVLCDSNAGTATRDGALMVSTIRAAMKEPRP